MGKQPYLVFSLRDEHFAIAAGAVRELFRLPELTPVEEAPLYIAGVLNLRKKIIPVTDLNLLFGHDRRKYLLTDSVIVLENAEQQKVEDEVEKLGSYEVKVGKTSASQLHEIRFLGLIVNEIHDVIEISAEDIEPAPFYSDSAITNSRRLSGVQHSAFSVQLSGSEGARHHFIESEARVGEDIIMLLNHNKVFNAGFQIEESKFEERDTLHEIRSFCPEATAEERDIFHQRAVNLMPAAEEEGLAGLMPLAVVSLGKEYFGMDLDLIREFSDIPDLTPIPCCPGHILGDMNLRGNVLTVIDIRESLNLPGFEKSKIPNSRRLNENPKSKFEGKVIVAATGGLSAGIAVDEVFDVIYLNPLDIKPAPSAVRTDTEQYLKGTAAYNSKVMTIIDLKKILEKEELVVNEEA